MVDKHGSVWVRILTRMRFLTEEKLFEEWLSPEIVDFLIDNYAVTDPQFGRLGWEYSQYLSPRRWGEFSAQHHVLRVSKAKTRDLFKQQVNTILHEIQHWNQYVSVTKSLTGPGRYDLWRITYDSAGTGKRYWTNRYEVDARDFATKNMDQAMIRIGKLFYSEKIEGGSLEQVVEELFDEYIESEKPLTRLQIGTVLRDYDLNTLENMKKVLEQLRSLEVKIAA